MRSTEAPTRQKSKRDLGKAIDRRRQGGLANRSGDDSQKVKDLRARLKTDAVDVGALESETYDHLYSFFRRYYSEGDFLAKRVYKPGVYAIPYEGEEVTLHWANKDHYYIKTSEYLRDYAFRLRPDDDKKPMRVHFRLTDATEGEHGNIKAAEGKDRVFVLAAPGESGHDFIAEEDSEQGKELVIRFEYRPATITDWPEGERDEKKKPPAQKDLSTLAAKRILAVTDAALAEWIAELAKPHVRASGEQADYSATRGAPPALHRAQHLRLLHPQGPRHLPPPGAGLLHQERSHTPGRRGERVRAARRAVPLQDQGHPQDRRQDHRLPHPVRRLFEEAVAQEEVRG